jgi:hypothetical protein
VEKDTVKMSSTNDSKLEQYRKSEAPLSATNRLWPLYGAGWENLGKEGGAMDLPLPQPGPDELLVRHDAVGICFSDIKVIRAGEKHPRIHRSMKEQPVVLGHEVALTVVEAGENLRDQYARRPLHRAGRHLHRRQDLRLRL